MNLRYERCTPEDLGLLTKLARKTFIDAFEVHNNPKDFSAYVNSALTESSFEKELLNPDSYFYFVKLKNKVVGYFKLNENTAQTELLGTDCFELERIYVSEEFQGKKIGRWMLQQIVDLAKKKDKTFLWLGVWEHNISAIKFYQRNGFSKFGEHPYYLGKDKQMDWLMRLDLVILKR